MPHRYERLLRAGLAALRRYHDMKHRPPPTSALFIAAACVSGRHLARWLVSAEGLVRSAIAAALIVPSAAPRLVAAGGKRGQSHWRCVGPQTRRRVLLSPYGPPMGPARALAPVGVPQ